MGLLKRLSMNWRYVLKMSEYRNRTICVDKHEIVVDRVHEITVVIEGGMCVDVRGLPEEWEYAIEDYDVEKQG